MLLKFSTITRIPIDAVPVFCFRAKYLSDTVYRNQLNELTIEVRVNLTLTDVKNAVK